jgi:hypothetical protein
MFITAGLMLEKQQNCTVFFRFKELKTTASLLLLHARHGTARHGTTRLFISVIFIGTQL